MTSDELLTHATRFVFGECVAVNMFVDSPNSAKMWRVYRLRDIVKFGPCIGKDLSMVDACEMAMKEGL